MSKTVFKVMVKIDTSKIKIKKYDDENLYNETTVVTKSEYLELMDLVKKTGFLPVRGVKIRFSDDTWDFTEAMFSTQYNQTKFHFSNAPPIYKDILKHYIFLKIVQGDVKLVTIDGRYDSVRRFAEYLFDSSVPIFSITPGFINMFFEQLQREKGLSIQTIKINVDVIKDFLLYFSEYNPDFSMEPFKSSILYKNFSKEIKASKEEGKTPNIPEDFYNGFIQGLISITKTERGVIGPYYNGNTMVMVACVLIIASQIGLRTGELIFLKANQLMTKSFIDAQGNKVKGCILNYETWKGAEFDGEVIWGNTVLNEMGQYAFNLLLDIFKEKRINIPKNFLVMTDSNNVLPLADTTFSRMYKQLLAKFADRLGCINLGDEYKDTLSYFNIGEDLKKKNISQLVAKGRDDSDEIFYPTITQFRVHTISSLIDKDVPLQYIKEMMSHLYAETTAGYTRLMEAREKPEEITAMYEDIAANNIKIIGPFGSEYNKQIKEFLENYKGENTHEDFKAIAEKITDKLPTRIKELGVCIKPTFSRECSKDANVDEFYCAYGVCQYIHHTFFMVSKTYEKYKLLVLSYENNASKGFKAQAEKEKHLVTNLVNNMLIPEMDELKSEIDKNGSENILSRYPKLFEAVTDYDEILKEVAKWQNLKQKAMQS